MRATQPVHLLLLYMILSVRRATYEAPHNVIIPKILLCTDDIGAWGSAVVKAMRY